MGRIRTLQLVRVEEQFPVLVYRECHAGGVVVVTVDVVERHRIAVIGGGKRVVLYLELAADSDVVAVDVVVELIGEHEVSRGDNVAVLQGLGVPGGYAGLGVDTGPGPAYAPLAAGEIVLDTQVDLLAVKGYRRRVYRAVLADAYRNYGKRLSFVKMW